jgi:hypothetical protein
VWGMTMYRLLSCFKFSRYIFFETPGDFLI